MLIYSILILLLSNAVTLKREKSIFYSRLSIIILIISSLLGIESLYILYLDRGISLYGGLFHITANTHIFNIFIYIISAIILQLTAFYPRKIFYDIEHIINKSIPNFKIEEKKGEEFNIMEFPLIILFIIIGGILLISSSDLVSIFLSIELQSYGLYLLSTLYRNSELATTSGLTYFLLGSLSSCFILLGASLLYANSGTTSLDNLYIISNISDMVYDNSNILYWYKSYYINFSLLIISIGFLFKVSAAPFHFWSPDVYDGVPTIVTTFVAIVAKISIFIFLLELIHYTSNYFFIYEFTWIYGLLVSSLLSLIIGTIAGLTQFRIKKLYAYSTISHVGFILLALSINSVESIQAFIFYIMQYSLTNLNAFIILISIGYSLFYYVYNNIEYNKLKDKDNSPIQLISQIKGYFYINPILAISLALTIFSFIGIPPLIGFFAKQMVLSAAIDNGYIFITLIAILTSVIGAVYYLGIIKQVFFDEPEYKFKIFYTEYISEKNNINLSIIKDNNIFRLSSSLTFTISTLTLIIILFMLMPQEWLSIANILALLIFNI
jgi:NADH-ubiquinone oxidoreductase chain 2